MSMQSRLLLLSGECVAIQATLIKQGPSPVTKRNLPGTEQMDSVVSLPTRCCTLDLDSVENSENLLETNCLVGTTEALKVQSVIPVRSRSTATFHFCPTPKGHRSTPPSSLAASNPTSAWWPHPICSH